MVVSRQGGTIGRVPTRASICSRRPFEQELTPSFRYGIPQMGESKHRIPPVDVWWSILYPTQPQCSRRIPEQIE